MDLDTAALRNGALLDESGVLLPDSTIDNEFDRAVLVGVFAVPPPRAPDIDLATIPHAASQGGINVDAIRETFHNRVNIRVFDPDDGMALAGTITDGAEQRFLDEAHGNGSFSFRVQNEVADPDAPVGPGYTPMIPNPSAVLAQRRLMYRFLVGGEPAFTGYAEARHRRLVSARKGADQFTGVAGRRWEAWLDKAWIQPPNMIGSQPSEPYSKPRRFNYIDPRYDSTDWDEPVELARQDGLTVAWTGLPPAWPDPYGFWLGRPGMVQNPAVGRFGASIDYYRAPIVSIADSGSYSIYAGADDTVQFFLDGAKLIDVAFGNVAQQGWSSTGYYRLNKWQGNISAGLHTFAAAVGNLDWPPINPTGFIAAIINDLTGEVAFHTSNNGFWQVLGDAPHEPGMTPGHVLEVLQLEAQARGILDEWELGCDRYVDSNGAAWPEVNDIVLTVGDPYTTALKRLNEAFCDIRHSRSGGQTDAYVKGTAGALVAVGFADTTGIATAEAEPLSNIVELTVDEVNERGNAVMFVWRNGSFCVEQPGFELGDGTDVELRIEDYLELGQIDTLAAAYTLAVEYASLALTVPTTYTLEFESRSLHDLPYKGDGVTPWDTVPIQAANGAVDTTERVESVSMDYDEVSERLGWKVELSDRFRDRLDRLQTLVERISAGGGGTTSNATAVSREDPLPFMAGVQFISFALPTGAAATAAGPQPVPMTGTIRELVVRRADSTGTTTIQIRASGVLIGSCTVVAGDELGKAVIDPPVKVAAHLDEVSVLITVGNDSATVAMVVVELAS